METNVEKLDFSGSPFALPISKVMIILIDIGSSLTDKKTRHKNLCSLLFPRR